MGRVDTKLLTVSVVLFTAGFVAAYPVMRYDVRVLQWYPLWIWRRVRESLSPDDPWLKLFVFLFGFNSLSLFVNFVSGWGVVLPYFLVFLLGLNLGVVGIQEAGGLGAFGMLALNPVAWLELPAAWTAATIGMQLGAAVVSGLGRGAAVFPELLVVYIVVVLPLLFFAALLEASLIGLFSRAASEGDV